MIVVGIVVLVAFVAGLYRARKERQEYTSFETTLSVKGAFVALVFCSHFRTYPTLIPFYDQPIICICDYLGQMMVAMFLFYSGYGILESLKRKGPEYIQKFPQKRILKVLVQFDIAVLCFLALGFFLGEQFSAKRVLLSLIAWDDLKNSNWYIFAILCAYVFSYLSFKWFKVKTALFMITLLSFAYIVVVSRFKGDYWWDTILCFPAGLYYSYMKDSFELNLRKHYFAYFIVSFVAFVFVNHFCRLNYFILGPLRSVLFCTFLTILLFKFPVNSALLKWLGSLVFPIYILQRIPMILFKHFGLDSSYELYFVLCLATTLLLAKLFSLFFDKIEKWIPDLNSK